ncbi:putative virulence protein VirF-like [Rhizobium mesoamericanum STM3625]|uniref:Putative virulence protein VirF-like n=1 Tax=Rhizobium mesoamericanum STM3625 TaxID=1211777 RepID=K0Q009_9HYPH|nr:putative virulence protein VirF-like [Rhizobium mesoamericanum STM3625]
MDRDRQRARTAGNSSRDGGGAERNSHFPNDLLAEVASRLPTHDTSETANNLANFELMSRSAREAVQASSVGTFHQRINRLGSSARALHDRALAQVAPDQGAPDRVFAQAVAPVLAPTFKFQTPERKTDAVDRILNIEAPRNQAMALAKIGDHLGDLDSANRSRLINRAVQLTTHSADVITRHNAARALLKGYHHLSAGQQSQLSVDYLQSVSTLPGDEPLAVSASRHAAQVPLPSLDRRIDEAQAQAHGHAGEQGPISRAQLRGMRTTAESLNRADSDARSELASSSRSRERNWGR